MAENEPKKSNYFPLWFYVAYPTTGASDTEMSLAGEATAGDMPQQPIPWPGSVVGMSIASEAAAAAGTMTVYATINGVTTGTSLVLEAVTNTQYTGTRWARGLYPITQNQRLGAQYTSTSTWTAGVSASIMACVWVHVEEN